MLHHIQSIDARALMPMRRLVHARSRAAGGGSNTQHPASMSSVTRQNAWCAAMACGRALVSHHTVRTLAKTTTNQRHAYQRSARAKPNADTTATLSITITSMACKGAAHSVKRTKPNACTKSHIKPQSSSPIKITSIKGPRTASNAGTKSHIKTKSSSHIKVTSIKGPRTASNADTTSRRELDRRHRSASGRGTCAHSPNQITKSNHLKSNDNSNQMSN